jgi:hypothetical protein
VPDPLRAPLACGALGPYRRERVQQIAALLGDGLESVHADESAILMLDRKPVEWGDRGQRGLGWVEGDVRLPSPGVADWRSAARAGVSGLVLDGRRRFLHSAVNGLAPIYWAEDGGAVYFASRIDPLARSSPSLLSVDWDAWAAIVAMRYPLGARTPFAEIRRLLPSSTLRRRFGRIRAREERWDWVEVEPEADLATTAARVADSLHGALDPLPDGLECPLSGGRDSRMLFLVLAQQGKVARVLTVPDDEGDSHEEDLAGPVAAAFDVPHERLAGELGTYPAEWEERARRVEYEFVDHAWLVPLAERVAGGSKRVPDGFGLDVFLSVGRHFYTPEVLDYRNARSASGTLFERLRRYGHGERALDGAFADAIVERAREQFLASVRQLEGHPAQAFLSLYANRSVRGVSTYSGKLIGDRAQTVTPGATDAFVRAALSLDPPQKDGGTLYRAVFELLDPKTAALPSTAEAPRQPPHLPRRWCGPPASAMHRRSLLDGPLAAHLSPELRAWIEGPEDAEPAGDLRLGVESVSLVHTWWRRYRDFLKPADAADLKG